MHGIIISSYELWCTLGLFLILIRAAIIPGIQPASVNKETIRIDPQSLSKIANGGKNNADQGASDTHKKGPK